MTKLPIPSLGTLNTVFDSLELVKKVWSGFNLPSQFAPTLNVEELDKRIADLTAVEQWLELNLNMLRGTIQSLSLQRSAVSAVTSLGDAAAKAADRAAAAMGETKGTSSAAPVALPQSQPTAPTEVSPVNPAAWWQLLQSQFDQIARATLGSATTPAASPAVSSSDSRAIKPKIAAKPGVRKKASSKRTIASSANGKGAGSRRRVTKPADVNDTAGHDELSTLPSGSLRSYCPKTFAA